MVEGYLSLTVALGSPGSQLAVLGFELGACALGLPGSRLPTFVTRLQKFQPYLQVLLTNWFSGLFLPRVRALPPLNF